MLLFVAVYLTEEFIDLYKDLNGYYEIVVWSDSAVYLEETMPIL